MAQLTKDEVKHVAKLSNLVLNDDEVQALQKQLSEVLNYVDELAEVKVEDIEPTSQTTGLKNVTRKDEVNVSRVFDQSVSTSQADKTHNGYFQVPPTIEKTHDDR